MTDSPTLAADAERQSLARWLNRTAGIGDGDPAGLTVAAPASGWSNETAILSVAGRRLVVRIAPRRASMFPRYDLDREWRILQTLHAAGTAPVPAPLGFDAEGQVLGRPLFVMSFVEGVVPADNKPTYAESGWLAEAAQDNQERFWRGFIGAMAGVHATDWRNRSLRDLEPVDGRTPEDAAMTWLEDLHAWSDAPQADIEAAFARLRETLPSSDAPAVLLWGDSRPANVLVRDFGIAALLDWELAHVGPAAFDVTWLQEMHWMRTVGAGIRQPAGFPDDDGIVRLYEQAAGQSLGDLSWYRLFAAAKVAVLLYRHLVVAIDRGAMPAGHPLLRRNVATRRLADLLDRTAA